MIRVLKYCGSDLQLHELPCAGAVAAFGACLILVSRNVRCVVS